MSEDMGAPQADGLSQAEPCSTVSALTGFDPSRKDDLFSIQMDLKRRAASIDLGIDATKALQWLESYGHTLFGGSNYAADFVGADEAQHYAKAALAMFAPQMRQRARELAREDMEAAYASAIEARSVETPQEAPSEGRERARTPNSPNQSVGGEDK